MLADNGCQDWWKLTPDNTGSYLNGTWTQLASLPPGYSPLYHSSAVLPTAGSSSRVENITSLLPSGPPWALSTTRQPTLGRL
jgi:hypothetical protein